MASMPCSWRPKPWSEHMTMSFSKCPLTQTCYSCVSVFMFFWTLFPSLILRLSELVNLQASCKKLSLLNELMDYSGNYVLSALPFILSLLQRGLGERIYLLAHSLPQDPEVHSLNCHYIRLAILPIKAFLNSLNAFVLMCVNDFCSGRWTVHPLSIRTSRLWALVWCWTLNVLSLFLTEDRQQITPR